MSTRQRQPERSGFQKTFGKGKSVSFAEDLLGGDDTSDLPDPARISAILASLYTGLPEIQYPSGHPFNPYNTSGQPGSVPGRAPQTPASIGIPPPSTPHPENPFLPSSFPDRMSISQESSFSLDPLDGLRKNTKLTMPADYFTQSGANSAPKRSLGSRIKNWWNGKTPTSQSGTANSEAEAREAAQRALADRAAAWEQGFNQARRESTWSLAVCLLTHSSSTVLEFTYRAKRECLLFAWITTWPFPEPKLDNAQSAKRWDT